MGTSLISIVTPCFNEEENIEEHFRRVSEVLRKYSDKYEFEHIYTDNDSTDQTFRKLEIMSSKDFRIKVLRFSRNIGPNRAIYMGLSEAQGDAIILILADLEDPPELLNDFIEGWESGFDVVYGKIKDRSEGFILKSFRKIYYRTVSALSEYPIPTDATEFRLTSKRVNKAVLELNDDNPYIRGNVAFVGYEQKAIEYKRGRRAGGKSSFNFLGLVSYAINGLTATTQVPIRFVMILGFLITILGFANVIFLVVRKLLIESSAPHGYVTLISLITFFAGVQIFSLGVIGEYIRKIYLQSLNRPKGYIREQINIPKKIK